MQSIAIQCHIFSKNRYIIQEGHKLELAQVQVPMTVTNAVSWRGPNLNYRKNECFLDVIESVDLLVRKRRSRAGGGTVSSHPVALLPFANDQVANC